MFEVVVKFMEMIIIMIIFGKCLYDILREVYVELFIKGLFLLLVKLFDVFRIYNVFVICIV